MMHSLTTFRRATALSLALVLYAGVAGFTAAQTARVQIIHNAADPAAAAVDVYVNGTLALDDFAFRAATPYLDLPAGEELTIAVAPGTSTGAADALATFPVTLADGGTYVVVANGVLDPSGFAANPDGRDTGFTLWIQEGLETTGGGVNLFTVHGASDAPTVDVLIREVRRLGKFVGDAAYGDATRRFSLPPKTYTLDVTPGADNNTVVASFVADLSGLNGQTAVVLASGFLNPAANQDGPAFGLIAVLADGTVVELPLESDRPTTARVQIIHNAADPSARMVDVYVNGTLALDDFAFRTATPYLDLPAGEELTIAVTSPFSTSADGALATFPVTLAPGGTYVVVANGVLAPSGFAANPDGRDTGFTLWVKADAREAATEANEVQFFAGHAASDAPTVDVVARGVATLVDDAAYGDLTDYIGVPAGTYTLDVTPGGDNATVVASFEADLSGLAGGAAVVLASGFLDPSANQGGPAFGLIAVLPDGTVAPLPAAASAAAGKGGTAEQVAVRGNYPNPFNPATTLRFDLPRQAEVRVEVYDMLGRRVLSVPPQLLPAGEAQGIELDGSALATGMYLYRLTARTETDVQVVTGRMTLLK